MAEHLGAFCLCDRVTMTLLESGPRVLSAFPDRVALAARRSLERRGVAVMTDAQVAEVRSDRLLLSDRRQIPADMMVWAQRLRRSCRTHRAGSLTNPAARR